MKSYFRKRRRARLLKEKGRKIAIITFDAIKKMQHQKTAFTRNQLKHSMALNIIKFKMAIIGLL